ncbi:MAG: hypothetical protein ACREYA_01085, partial [Cupriavidus necator]
AALLCTGLVDASLANAAYQRSDAHWWGYKVTIIAMRGRWYGQPHAGDIRADHGSGVNGR